MPIRIRRLVKYGLILGTLCCLVIFLLHMRLREDEIPLQQKVNIKDFETKENIKNNALDLYPTKRTYGFQDRINENHLMMDGSRLYAGHGDEDTVNYDVHAFYYAWYGNPGIDGQYYHWNHEYLPHWIAKISAQYPTGKKHVPPNDVGASFYPLLGPYSSMDESVTRAHMLQMRRAGIGVLALSWYPPGQADDHGKPAESYVPTIFDIADEYSLKVCFHIEPFKDRTATTIRDNIKYILDKYGQHPAFYRRSGLENTEKLPLIYVYDSYQVGQNEWRKLLSKGGEHSIRNTPLDSILIGLLVEGKHMGELVSSGFDGFYTYFAADGFSYGSTRRNWHDIARSAQLNKMIFIPSIGPGYDDTKVRPWNFANSRLRRNGSYYGASWEKVLELTGVDTVSITSFNEWHEGTQIEPAAPQSKQADFPYLTYAPGSPDFYLELTKKWSMKFLYNERQK